MYIKTINLDLVLNFTGIQLAANWSRWMVSGWNSWATVVHFGTIKRSNCGRVAELHRVRVEANVNQWITRVIARRTRNALIACHLWGPIGPISNHPFNVAAKQQLHRPLAAYPPFPEYQIANEKTQKKSQSVVKSPITRRYNWQNDTKIAVNVFI